MAASPMPALPAVVAIAPRLEPHLVEVVVWYPFGAADEAVAAAAAKVAEVLAAPDLGAPTADTPDVDEDSPRVATAAMVQAVARLVIEEARKIAAAAVVDLMTKPGVMSGMLPTEPPPDAETPWLNKGGLAITPKA
ncbi:hypothetical protein [Methylobacterium sp. C1]|uniref:hypothetical protein n=1 Tax=Methylobacterium sp. C1 TaxID=1479019 RepID=UPI001331C3EE|nr:hypothetical protein [Methylobacterium sp. C1]